MPLVIRKHKGSPYWHARGTIPVRQPDGSIIQQRHEESTREKSRARALRAADRLWDFYTEQAYRPKPKSISFIDAAITYGNTKERSKHDKRFVAKLITHFGERGIADIDQADVAAAAHALYPGCSPGTHDRAVFAPTITILRLSGIRTEFTRPKIKKTPPSVPAEAWFDTVLPHCPGRLAALLIALTLTGRRVSELLTLTERNLDDDGNLSIAKTKTGTAVVVSVPDSARKLLVRRDPHSRSTRLFGYSTKENVYRALKRACDRAGVLVRDDAGNIVDGWYPTHSLGRHAFATRLLKAGWSVKHVAAAGGWANAKLVLSTYGHLEQKEVDRDVRAVGESWESERERRKKDKENQ